jgi:hypothetical protein
VLYVHSCPPAICPHVEWALASVLGVSVRLCWTAQPMSPGHLRGEAGWRGRAGTAGRLAAALRGWPQLRYEITEEPSDEGDGERYAVTPSLGVFRTAMSANGDVLVHEERLRSLLLGARDPMDVLDGVRRLLGEPWDAELEPFRSAGEGAPVRWLTQTG